jgi:hypothetical protein
MNAKLDLFFPVNQKDFGCVQVTNTGEGAMSKTKNNATDRFKIAAIMLVCKD